MLGVGQSLVAVSAAAVGLAETHGVAPALDDAQPVSQDAAIARTPKRDVTASNRRFLMKFTPVCVRIAARR